MYNRWHYPIWTDHPAVILFTTLTPLSPLTRETSNSWERAQHKFLCCALSKTKTILQPAAAAASKILLSFSVGFLVEAWFFRLRACAFVVCFQRGLCVFLFHSGVWFRSVPGRFITVSFRRAWIGFWPARAIRSPFSWWFLKWVFHRFPVCHGIVLHPLGYIPLLFLLLVVATLEWMVGQQ